MAPPLQNDGGMTQTTTPRRRGGVWWWITALLVVMLLIWFFWAWGWGTREPVTPTVDPQTAPTVQPVEPQTGSSDSGAPIPDSPADASVT